MKRLAVVAMIIFGGLSVTVAEAQRERTPPYWASIAASEAMMRTGPAKTYPATWLYRRADLPIRILELYPTGPSKGVSVERWRKVQDPDGTTGWMLVNLLSDQRTALVRGDGPRPVHERPDAGSKIRYRAEPGVVGRLSNCGGDWCELNVGGREGYIQTADIWGVDPRETFD